MVNELVNSKLKRKTDDERKWIAACAGTKFGLTAIVVLDILIG